MSCVTPNQSHTVAIESKWRQNFSSTSESVSKGLLEWETEHHLPLAPVQLPAMRKTPGCKFTTHINHVTKKSLGRLENKSKDGKK